MTPIKDALEKIAPAVEQLACHQTQLDQDGVMVGVSRQAIDEVVNAINEIAISITTPAPGRDELRERIARIIDPTTFEKFDAEIAKDRQAENGRRWADVCHGEAINRALAKADTILSALPISTKKVYIKSLRTIVEIQTTYADQIRDLLNAGRAPDKADAILSALPAAPVVDEAAIRADVELLDALIAADGLLQELGHSLPQVKAATRAGGGER